MKKKQLWLDKYLISLGKAATFFPLFIKLYTLLFNQTKLPEGEWYKGLETA